ncbi:MAG: hypothetical protein L0Y43_03340 [Methylococcaceae bacterium]|nr:hypothetical protein [Methylococcaceae bacterium]
MTIYTSASAILAVSIIGSLFLVQRNRSLDHRVAKIMMFGLYFWLLTFAQAIVYSLAYQTVFK